MLPLTPDDHALIAQARDAIRRNYDSVHENHTVGAAVRCADGSLYTGWTNDLDARLEAHRSGRGAKYTRSHLPVELAYCEEHETKEAAMSREWQIKRLTRQQKLALIEKK